MKSIFFIIIALSIIVLSSCNIINPVERTPTYIHIDSFSFLQTPHSGTASNKITNVMVFIDYAPIGMYDLPADIPVLLDKPVSLMLMPAVQYAGISSRVIPYPFFRADTSTLMPAPGTRVNIAPVAQYFPDTLLRFVHEDFESGNSFIVIEGDTLQRTSDPAYVFEGAYSGLIKMKDSAYSLNIMTVGFSMPATGVNRAEVFLEMNYKCSIPFVLGLQSSDASGDFSQFLFGFNPRDSWNKVYIPLEDFITNYQNMSYRVMISASKTKQGTDYIALDNFKVVSRK